MKSWKRIEPTEVIRVGWRDIVIKNFVIPNGKVRPYTTHHSEGVQFAAVIALTPDDKVIVARQFRPGPERFMDELPGGVVDEGEDPRAGAARELFEETGYRAKELELIGRHCGEAYSNAIWSFYLATGCELMGEQSLDEGEFVDVHLISVTELIDNAMQNRMTDGIAVLYAYERLKALAEGTTE